MAKVESPRFSVSEFIAVTNQTLEYAYPSVEIEGEVASFKVNQGKYVFFDLKDAESSVGCFMMVFALRVPLEDGMKVVVRAVPKLTKWGKFSLTVQAVRPSGEGSLKKSFELLKAKLDKEGLFAPERKRALPSLPQHIAVVSSTQAAGYADFMKIVDARWGGMQIDVAHVQVQGEGAPDQMIRALEYINQQEVLPEVIVLIRGGGSADDLAAFNDEPLVRAVAGSRVPVLAGIGHEVDESLVDLAADVRAATPSHAAQLLTPDKTELARGVKATVNGLGTKVYHVLETLEYEVRRTLERMLEQCEQRGAHMEQQVAAARGLLAAFNPQSVLRRGYALLRGEQTVGSVLEVETMTTIMQTEVKDVRQKAK